MGLLFEEPNGLAVDFTDTADYVLPTWRQQSVRQRADIGINLRSSPHEFFTQSGTSPKYVKGATHSLEWSPHNLKPGSEQIGNTDGSGWAPPGDSRISVASNVMRAPTGLLTADKLTTTDTSNCFVQAKDITGVAGAVYTVSCHVKAGTADYIKLLATDNATTGVAVTFNTATGALEDTSDDPPTATIWATHTEDAGNGWFRVGVSYSYAPTAHVFIIYVSDTSSASASAAVASGATMYLWGVQVSRGMVPGAYMATHSVFDTAIGLPISYGEGLLTEPSATNIALQSQALATTWVIGNSSASCTITSDATTSPDGTATADKVVCAGGLQEHYIYQDGLSGLGTGSVTASIYAKAAELNYVHLIFGSVSAGSNDWAAAEFNLSNGTVVSTDAESYTANSASITAIGNGWYRCSVTATCGSAAPDFIEFGPGTGSLTFTDGSNGVSSQFSSNGNGVYIWGAQFETGAVATSYIPTFGSTVTRAADDISAPTNAWAFSASVGAIYSDAVRKKNIEDYDDDPRYLTLSDGTSSERIMLLSRADDDDECFQVQDGGVLQVEITAITPAVVGNVRVQLAGTWQVNNFAASVNGGAAVTDSTGTLPTLTELQLGDTQSNDRNLNGLIRRIVYVARRVTDGDLPTWRYEA